MDEFRDAPIAIFHDVAFTMDVYSHAIPSMEAETIANLVRRSGPGVSS